MSRITSRFSALSTAAEVLEGHSLHGKNIIVTGATTGIGVATARALAQAGANVMLAVRRFDAGVAIAREINAALGVERATAEQLDLASFASIRKFVAGWRNRPLHVLINNAGVMATPLGYTEDNLEMQIGTNHFGHYLLTMLLTPSLIVAAPSRVLVLTSGAHHLNDVDFSDLHYRTRRYNPLAAYGQSKAANCLFALGFAPRFIDRGITINMVMPGAVITELGAGHVTQETFAAMGELGWFDERISGPIKTLDQGASNSVWAAVAPELEGMTGLYLEDCSEALPYSAEWPFHGLHPCVQNPDDANRLWRISAETCGVAFD
jgi:NAD(P)-dependent dehydrogenase (short-subunit alcohol dehydrogenase family)